MNDHSQFMPLKINPVIADAKPMHDLSSALQFPEMFQVRAHDFLGQSAKLAEDVELQILWHARQLRGAGRIENDLERAHLFRQFGTTLQREVNCAANTVELASLISR